MTTHNISPISTVRTPSPSRAAIWKKRISIVLVLGSFALTASGLFCFSLTEPTYQFLLSLGPDAHYSEWMWRNIAISRFVGWALLPLSITQAGLAGWTLWRLVHSRPTGMWTVIRLGIGVLILLGSELFWINQMAPSAELLHTVQRSTQGG